MKSTRPVAVITGAARGIGKGCALELARGGFNLLINDLQGSTKSQLRIVSLMTLRLASSAWGETILI